MQEIVGTIFSTGFVTTSLIRNRFNRQYYGVVMHGFSFWVICAFSILWRTLLMVIFFLLFFPFQRKLVTLSVHCEIIFFGLYESVLASTANPMQRPDVTRTVRRHLHRKCRMLNENIHRCALCCNWHFTLTTETAFWKVHVDIIITL